MKTKEIAELAVRLSKALPTLGAHLCVDEAFELTSRASRHRKLCERLCNEDDGEDGPLTRRRESLERKTVAYAKEQLGLRVSFQHDPRGGTVRLHFPDGAANTMGGREEGYAI